MAGVFAGHSRTQDVMAFVKFAKHGSTSPEAHRCLMVDLVQMQ
jgi:hypothetical protein